MRALLIMSMLLVSSSAFAAHCTKFAGIYELKDNLSESQYYNYDGQVYKTATYNFVRK